MVSTNHRLLIATFFNILPEAYGAVFVLINADLGRNRAGKIFFAGGFLNRLFRQVQVFRFESVHPHAKQTVSYWAHFIL